MTGHLKVDGTPNIDISLHYIKPGEEEKVASLGVCGVSVLSKRYRKNDSYYFEY